MNRQVIGAVLLAVVVLLVGLGLWLLSLWPVSKPPVREEVRAESAHTTLGIPEAPAADAAPSSAIPSTMSRVTRPVGTPEQEAERERTRALAEAFRRRLTEARSTRLAAGGVGAVGPVEAEERLGRLEPQYIRDAVQQIRPLIVECYEMAAEAAESEGQNAPEGRLIAEFEIAGEESVGGVVERSEISEDSDITHPMLDECLRETLYTLELPAPEGGGRVTVRYPFVFRQAPDDTVDDSE